MVKLELDFIEIDPHCESCKVEIENLRDKLKAIDKGQSVEVTITKDGVYDFQLHITGSKYA